MLPELGLTDRRRPLGSVVIPAHNEAQVIRRCLDALFSGFDPGELDVVVVCNGCHDETSTVARFSGHPVRVVELEHGSKPAALRAGDRAAIAFPRMYLDADVVLHGSAARSVLERLHHNAVAARPPIEYDSHRSSALVRRYYRARVRMPALHGALWGAGVYGLSEAGRSRFQSFPDVVGDDLWVDRHFSREEVEIVDCTPVIVGSPRRARDLVRVLRRTYRGKSEELPGYQPDAPVPKTLTGTLRDLGRLVATSPGSAVDAATYAAFAITGRLGMAVAAPGDVTWERDDSSRTE
jgi:glycosyltransferase involved in cell wall biosynthesis